MSSIIDDPIIPAVRSFNRFYTRQIGLLNEHIVRSAFSLAEARVLYEIGIRGHTTATELAGFLDLDRAYLSRILQGFLAQELVDLSPIPSDHRQNSIALTHAGDAVFFTLNAGSDAAVTEMLAHLGAPDRQRLAAAMETVRKLLGDELTQPPIVLRPHRVGELGWLIHRQAVLYNQQFGWNSEFETLIARIYHDYEQAGISPPKALWIADRGGSVAGSVFLRPHPTLGRTAQLRMLYVEPEARGLGIGTLLVDHCVSFARDSGYARLRLWTQSVLTSARRIYAAAGFQLIESGPHRSFGHDLVGEYWELAF